METIEFIIGIIVGTPLAILGFGIFIAIWWYSFKWLLIGMAVIVLKFFKKDSWQYNFFGTIFVGGGALLSFYFMIYLFIVIAKKMGF